MSLRSDVLLWAQRVVAKKGVPPHQVLEINPDDSVEMAQAAFHKIARMAHPDLHRNSLTDDELELVTTAYARVAAAYQDLRNITLASGRTPARRDDPPPPRPRTPSAAPPIMRGHPTTQRMHPITKPPTNPGDDPAGATGGNAPGAMSPKALLYYRKAELALRRGDLKGAVLQLKMAIACDPTSVFLRTALAEVEAEVRK